MNSQQHVVLITGSSGLIGYTTACRFVRDYDVMGFDRVGPPHPPPETEYVLDCDVTSDESARRMSNGCATFLRHTLRQPSTGATA